VIKIRHSDLPGGLHVRVDVQGRNTILYLLPGLTAVQRKAAIRRARSAARVGHGPGLPALGVARALAADRIRTTVRNGLAAMRMHPAIFFPPMIIIVAAAVAYLLLASLSVRFIPSHSSGPNVDVGIGGGNPVPPGGSNGPVDPPASGPAPASRRSQSGPAPPGRGQGRAASPHPASSRSASPSASPSRVPSSSGQPEAPSPTPSDSQPWTPAPAPSSSPSSSAAPGSGSGGGGVCVKVGPLGVCLGV
jgi:hypothetical protein